MIKSFSQYVAESNWLVDDGLMDILGDLANAGLFNKKKFEVLKLIDSTPAIKEAFESPQMKKLISIGLEPASTKNQLLNGNIIFSRKGEDLNTNYGLGVFLNLRCIRRMVPRQSGRIDTKIKTFDTNLSDSQFYRVAMQWAIDHIDFDSNTFLLKSKTGKDYFNNLSI